MLAREDRGELVRAGVEQLAELEHHRLPLRDRRVAPCAGTRGAAAARRVDVFGRGEAHALLLDAERGVVDGAAAVGRSARRPRRSSGRGSWWRLLRLLERGFRSVFWLRRALVARSSGRFCRGSRLDGGERFVVDRDRLGDLLGGDDARRHDVDAVVGTNGSSPRATSAVLSCPSRRAGSGSRVSRSATSSSAQNTPSPRTSPIERVPLGELREARARSPSRRSRGVLDDALRRPSRRASRRSTPSRAGGRE